DDFDKNDKIAEQEVLTLQRKYDAYGGNWGPLFSQAVAAFSQKASADAKQKSRLDDTTTEIGQDAHRAAELNLSMQRISFMRARQAITPQVEQQLNAGLQAQLASLLQKYATGAQAADFRD